MTPSHNSRVGFRLPLDEKTTSIAKDSATRLLGQRISRALVNLVGGLFVVGFISLGVSASSLRADEPVAGDNSVLNQMTADELRAWLSPRLRQLTRDPRAQRQIDQQLRSLPVESLRILAQRYQYQMAAAQLELARAQQARNQLQQQLAAQRWAQGIPPQGVGFRPVITTLPEGAQLNAGAVISPDGRSVRINAAPFFSSVPGFHTFNYYNGQTRWYPTNRRRQPSATPRVWYDGLRTRTGRPPK